MWNNWAREKHWNQKEKPLCETLDIGMPNILNGSTVSQEKISFLLYRGKEKIHSEIELIIY